jgi:2,4-diaminopentanoate dehydrogenase
MHDSHIPVVCFGLGPVGVRIAQRLASRTAIDIVGAVDVDPTKVGSDFGTFIDRAVPGINIGIELPEPPSSGRGVVVHATTSRLSNTADQLLHILDAGWNVLSTCEELMFPAATSQQIADELDRRARAAGVSVLGTGINPGFLMDTLVLALSGACTEVDSVAVRRVVDTNKRRIPLQQKAGVGKTEQEFRKLVEINGIGHVGLRQSAHLIAHRMGWAVDDYQETLEPVIAARDTDSGLGLVPAGDVIGQRQVVFLRSAGRVVVHYDLEMSVGSDAIDAIRIEGQPTINQVIEGGVNGDAGTEAMMANLVPVVASAVPGLLTMGEIVPLNCLGSSTSS